jgi:hypothetical protein
MKKLSGRNPQLHICPEGGETVPTSYIELSGAPGDRFVDHAPGTLLDNALAYAAIGWRVFPLAPRSKVPLYSNPHPADSPMRATCKGRAGSPATLVMGDGAQVPVEVSCSRDGHGCNDATTDPEVIQAWWWRTPSANIGLATGCPHAGGAGGAGGAGDAHLCSPDVVDIDVKPMRQHNGTKMPAPGLDSMKRLHDAGLLVGVDAIVETPSGGLHLYFAGTAQGNGTLRGHGVDFRSWGGYVVAPPSVVTVDVPPAPSGAGGTYGPVDRTYRWLRVPGMSDPVEVSWSALKAHLRPDVPRPDDPRDHAGRHAGGSGRVVRPAGPDRFNGLIEWLLNAAEGNRNNALHWAVCQALEHGADRTVVMALEGVARQLGLDEAEIRKTVASAQRRASEVLRADGAR